MKSPFWSYFHDKLNWLPIFRPGPVSAIMKGLALHMDEVRQDILWLREQWNPATCEQWLLERYGASRGIFRTRFDTDESYRKRVIYAYAWHKLGGKVKGVTQILAENGFEGAIIQSVNDVRRHDAMLMHDGRATYNAGLCWAQFDVKCVEIPETGLNRDVLDFLRWLINEYKPARSILRALTWKVTLVDEAAFEEATTFHVIPTYLDLRPWGFPSHNGQIRYDNGISRLHDGKLAYSAKHPHSHWQPSGHCHDCVIDPLAMRLGLPFSECLRFNPKHDGLLRHDAYGIHGQLPYPALDKANIRTVPKYQEVAESSENLSARIKQMEFEDIGRYHDASLTHGQRRVCLHSGAFNHSDSRIYHGLEFGGNPSFRPVRHDGFATYASGAMHRLWGWLPKSADKLPAVIYSSLRDIPKLRCASSLADILPLGSNASEKLETAIAPNLAETVKTSERAAPEVRPHFSDTAAIYHNGSITHDQRKASLHLGARSHDGTFSYSLERENPALDPSIPKPPARMLFADRFQRHQKPSRHNGRRSHNPIDHPDYPAAIHSGAAFHNGKSAHHPWSFLEEVPEKSWPFLHRNLSDSFSEICSFRFSEALPFGLDNQEDCKTSIAPLWRDFGPAPTHKSLKKSVRPTFLEDWSRRHDGAITHGQRQIGIHSGTFRRDGSARRGPYGGVPELRPAKHDSGILRNGKRQHKYWGWMPVADNGGPAFTYQTLADDCAMRFRLSDMEDVFEMSDSWNLAVTRYSLRQSQILHNGANHHQGKEIQA